MNAFDKCVLNLALETRIFINKFLYDEEGDVNIITMVILIAIAVALAALFRTRIIKLVTDLLSNIDSSSSGLGDPISET